jgi:hypothetical protein
MSRSKSSSFDSASIAPAVDHEAFEILPEACLGVEAILTAL